MRERLQIYLFFILPLQSLPLKGSGADVASVALSFDLVCGRNSGMGYGTFHVPLKLMLEYVHGHLTRILR